jgi:hypothetical protein
VGARRDHRFSVREGVMNLTLFPLWPAVLAVFVAVVVIVLAAIAAWEKWRERRNDEQLRGEIEWRRAAQRLRFDPEYRERLARFNQDTQ